MKTILSKCMALMLMFQIIACGPGTVDGLVSSDSIAPYDVGNGTINQPTITAEHDSIYTYVTILGNVDGSSVQHKIEIKFQNDSGVVREIRDLWGDDLNAPIGASFVSCDTNGAYCYFDPGNGAEEQFAGIKIQHNQALREITLDLVPLGVMFEGQEPNLPWTSNTLDGDLTYPQPIVLIVTDDEEEIQQTNEGK